MAAYRRDEEGASWYMMRKELDREAVEASEGLLGVEREVFIQSMALLAEMLNAAFAGGLVRDLPTKMKIGVANHAFNLMWSAWQNALTGRYDAATDHWRSIDESPDFLAALQVNPSLAKEMLAGKVKIKTARTTIAKEINRLKAGEGNRWYERQKWRGIHNRFAHVDAPGTTAALPISSEGAEPSVLVRPGGGVIHPRNLRMMALYLAEVATNFTWWVTFAFQDINEVCEIWETRGREFNQRGHSILKDCASAIGVEV
jgi:hypothetical protein